MLKVFRIGATAGFMPLGYPFASLLCGVTTLVIGIIGTIDFLVLFLFLALFQIDFLLNVLLNVLFNVLVFVLVIVTVLVFVLVIVNSPVDFPVDFDFLVVLVCGYALYYARPSNRF